MSRKHHFTLEERVKIQEMLERGLSHSDISYELRRPRETIRSEIIRHTIDGAYVADFAHEEAQAKLSERNRFISKMPRRHDDVNLKDLPQVLEKLDIIQFQMEIMVQQLRSLNDRYKENN